MERPDRASAADPLEGLRSTPDPRDPRGSSLLLPYTANAPLRGRLAVLGLPYDGGIPSRPGARFGPRALRQALDGFGTFDGSADAAVALDLGDLDLPTTDGREVHERIERAAERIFAEGSLPIFLGGDHGCTGSVIRGLAAARPRTRLALISIDAHLDVREYQDQTRLSSGTPFRRALETPVLTGERMASIGIRRFANSRYYTDWARGQGVRIHSVEDVASWGATATAEAALAEVAADADALYLSIDLDAADASVAPGVSAPGVGGLSSREMIELVGALARDPRLVGADLMELSPPHDPDGRTARLAARLLLELLAARAA